MKKRKLHPLQTAAIVFLAALTVRLVYVAQIQPNPFATVPLFDSKLYLQQAGDLITHGPLYGGAYILGPLYVYFLAAISIFAANDIAAIMAAQAILGALACAITAKLGEELFDGKTGLAAGLAAAAYGPLVFYSGVILTEPVLIFVNTVLIYLLTKAYMSGSPKAWLAAGLMLGVSAWGKSNILLLAPFIIALNWLYPKTKGTKMAAAWLVLGLIIAIAPITARNVALGSLAPVTGNAGVNLYIGNNPKATGTFIPLNELIDSSGNAYHISDPTATAAGTKTILDADPIFLRQSLDYIAGHPFDWAALMFRKAMLYLNAYEIPDQEDYGFMSAQTMLRYLIPSMALIAPLGLLGMWMNIRKRQTWPATIFILVYGLSFILFFVKARFRIALMPAVILFAADAFWQLVKIWQTGREKIAKPAVALLLFIIVVNNPAYAARIEGTGMYNPYNNLGQEYANQGQTDKAIGYYIRAIEYSPSQYEPYNNLGEACNRLGEYDKAEETLRKALSIKSNSPYAHNNLGTALYGQGRLSEAESQYKDAISENPQYYEARANLATVYMRTNRLDEAIAELKKAEEISPQDSTVRENLQTIEKMKDLNPPAQ